MTEEPVTAVPPSQVTEILDQVISNWYESAASAVVRFDLENLGAAIELLELNRLENATKVFDSYGASEVFPYLPVWDSRSIPHLGVLVERSKEGLLILDGTHRAFAAFRSGATHIGGILISPSQLIAAPSKLIPLSHLRTVADGGEPKYRGRNVPLFRPAYRWVSAWQELVLEKGPLTSGN